METILKSFHGKLLTAIPLVQLYDQKLRTLTDWWQKITLIGKINSHNVPASILDDMQGTKATLSELHHKLIRNLLREHLQKRILSDESKSQVAIDILVRNLFERTADVGFLATDYDIRAFLANPAADAVSQAFIEARLREYVEKYSVYDEVVILDSKGCVRAHLDQDNPIQQCNDPLIRETLHAGADYLETFRRTDIQPNQSRSLIYSCRINASNDRGSEVLGVLCLCFRFDDEMAGIFTNLLDGEDGSVLMILDATGAVISSSDTTRIPLKTHYAFGMSPQIIRNRSGEYLTNTTRSNGYQGFTGLSWSSQIMTHLSSAFRHSGSQSAESSDDEKKNGSRLFSQELQEIHRTSLNVNDDLSLVVLNGKIAAARNHASEFIPVLEEIKKIGEDTAEIFYRSISNLQSTVLSSRMSDVQFIAALAVDIMDRNLYERANDCRWWALTSAFRFHLAKSKIKPEDAANMSEILAYINGLYTVYTNLYLYDRKGRVVAVSNPHEQGMIGKYAEEKSGATAALANKDSQKYVVSPFLPSPFYHNRHTYIFNASITELSGANQVVGGIGIVFDSEPQFDQILVDTLPRGENGQVVEGCFGVFAERSGRVIAATAQSIDRPGDMLLLDQHFFSMANGQKCSEFIVYRDKSYTLGAAVSKGYREFKTSGDYSNDVIAFIFIPI